MTHTDPLARAAEVPTPSTDGQQGHELRRAGTTLRYLLYGPAEAPLVAFTHGVSLDHRAFSDQVPMLAAAGYRVLTWDVRGHGASRPLGAEITIRDVSDDLLAVLDATGVEQAVIAGQSFGGMVVQDLLARHPDRVAAMVVIGAPPLGDRPGAVMRALQRLRVASTRIWPDRNLRWVFATMVTRDPKVRDYVTEATGRLPKADFIAVSRAAMDGYLQAADVPTHGVPLLLVHGEREERMVARTMSAWATGDPYVRYEVIPAAGHLVNQEAPEPFNGILLEFLDDVLGQQGSATSAGRPEGAC